MVTTAPQAKVIALPGAHRPDDALKFLREALADDDETIRGVILTTVNADGSSDTRIYGEVRRFEIAYAGAVLSDHAVNGDFEAA